MATLSYGEGPMGIWVMLFLVSYSYKGLRREGRVWLVWGSCKWPSQHGKVTPIIGRTYRRGRRGTLGWGTFTNELMNDPMNERCKADAT